MYHAHLSKPLAFVLSQWLVRVSNDLRAIADNAAAQDLASLPRRWAAAWSEKDPCAWLSLYTPTATYLDHSFFVRRTGISILKRHIEIWKQSIPDFTMEVQSEMPVTSKDGKELYSFRTINKGTLVNDLPSKRAFGKTFSFSGVVDFVVDGGLIEEVNEWYSWDFDNSKDVTEYHTLDDTKNAA